METVGTVLIWFGAIVALLLGLLIAVGVIRLDGYIERYQEEMARQRRARERRSRES